MTSLGESGPVVVVGAGPAGSLLALYLARRGLTVEVYESRPDLRRVDVGAGRSINLALATRGIVALREVGVAGVVDPITIPMAGRMVHAGGAASFQPYGTKEHEVIRSVSRRDLNAILLDAAEATGRVRLHFGRRCRAVDFERDVVTFSDDASGGAPSEVPFGTVFGCDGAASTVRSHLQAANGGTVAEEPLDHGYKELSMPPAAGGGFRLDPHVLHIWPRGELMLIALANPAGDFTATLFMPNRGPADSFEALAGAADVDAFLARHFDDVVPLIPDATRQFLGNPTGRLSTIRTTGWSLGDRALLVGDAAHAIVPFHGQGMNLAMESCRLLDRQLGRHPADTARAFAAFEAGRRADADAIADMALDNYLEMRAGVVDPVYLIRRALALELEHRHPERFAPRYGMVMFTTMPYAAVKRRAEQQLAILAELTRGVSSVDEVDFDRAAELADRLGPLPAWV